ncbi:hypothetical protein FRB96_007888 [Tulasnella sp. 330]|nr:hypothetical protein FRB96_007888 [Tulasnella sp. 330]
MLWHNPHPGKRLIFSQAQAHSSQSPIQSQSQTFAPPVAPLLPAPVPKTAAISFRTVMNNIENVIVEFSGRVDALVEEVKQAQSEVVETSRLHEEGLAEVKRDLQSHVSACHSSLQTSVTGNRAFLEKILDQQASLSDHLTNIEERLSDTESRMVDQERRDDQIRSQLQDMAGQLLKILIDFQSLSPILPNVQALPLHVQTAKNDIVDFVRQELATSSTALSHSLSQAVVRLEGLTRPNPIQELVPAPPAQSASFGPIQSQHDHTTMRDQILSFLLLSQPTAVNTPNSNGNAITSSSSSKRGTSTRPQGSVSDTKRLVTFEESDDDDDDDTFPSPKRRAPTASTTMTTRSTRARKVDANHIYAIMPSKTQTAAFRAASGNMKSHALSPGPSPTPARTSGVAENRVVGRQERGSRKPKTARARRTLDDSPAATDFTNITDWI